MRSSYADCTLSYMHQNQDCSTSIEHGVGCGGVSVCLVDERNGRRKSELVFLSVPASFKLNAEPGPDFERAVVFWCDEMIGRCTCICTKRIKIPSRLLGKDHCTKKGDCFTTVTIL